MTEETRQRQMPKSVFWIVGIVVVIAAILIIFAIIPRPEAKSPIRLGWQVSWATQGQLAQTLKHTNILELNGLKGELKGFSYGAPLNEAALAGAVDVIFTADLPATSLISRAPSWRIVARLVAFRATLIIPPKSAIQKVADLKGKTVAIPFGSSTHRIVLGMMKEAGLDTEKDVVIKNLDILEQASVVDAGTDESWGEIDAFASWDPHIAIFESKGKARVIELRKGISVVVMSGDYIEKHRKEAVRFLKSYVEAYFFYATHQKEANELFAAEARLKFDPSLLDVAASYEQNMQAKTISDIDVLLNPNQIAEIEAGVDFAYELKLIKSRPDVNKAIDMSLLQEALKEIKTKGFDVSSIKIIEP